MHKYRNAQIVILLVLSFLFLSACSSGKDGNYITEGIFVSSENGRSYLYVEENSRVLLMYDCTEDGDLFDDAMTGFVISVDGVHKKNEISYHAEVRELSVKKQNEIDEELEDIIDTVGEIDEAYSKLTATGTCVISSQGNHYFIDTSNANKVILLKNTSEINVFEHLETGDSITIAPANILRNEVSYYARVDVCEKNDGENTNIPSECVQEIKRIENVLLEIE